MACGHGMPSEASCIECIMDGPGAVVARGMRPVEVPARMIAARKAGQCGRCGRWFPAGAKVGATVTNGRVGACCAGGGG